jgi:hypothetical protein
MVPLGSLSPPLSPRTFSHRCKQMKQCPTCHFTFADFHSVCTFDGAELVPYEKPLSLMKVARPPTHPRLSLKPSMSLTSVAVLTVFLGAVLIGYLKSPNPSIPAVAIQDREANSASSTTRADRTEGIRAESKRITRATRVRGNQNRRVATSKAPLEVTRVVVRSPSPTIVRPREVPQTWRVYPPNTTIARQREVQPESRDKPRKVVAILKTTWKVLKKPFDF